MATKKPSKKTTKKKAPVKKPKGALASVRATLSKALEDDPVRDIDPNQLKTSMPHIMTGSLVLDYLIGGPPNKQGVPPCPGWPKGMISNIYGRESSGKTTIALEAAASVIDGGGTVAFIDWEHAISLDYAHALGVPVDDPERFLLAQPNTLEDGLVTLMECAKQGVDLIVLDSVGAGVLRATDEKKVDDVQRIGGLASWWSRVLPMVAKTVSGTGSHVMGISQLRSAINTGGYGPKDTPQGGNAWKFYTAVRLRFTPIGSVKTKDYDATQNKEIERVTSRIVKARMEKTKVSNTQQRELTFHVTFGEGVDNVLDMIAIGVNHGIVKKGGAWYTYERPDGTAVKGQGLPSFKCMILADDDVYDELFSRVLDAMRKGYGDNKPVLSLENDVPEELGSIT